MFVKMLQRSWWEGADLHQCFHAWMNKIINNLREGCSSSCGIREVVLNIRWMSTSAADRLKSQKEYRRRKRVAGLACLRKD